MIFKKTKKKQTSSQAQSFFVESKRFPLDKALESAESLDFGLDSGLSITEAAMGQPEGRLSDLQGRLESVTQPMTDLPQITQVQEDPSARLISPLQSAFVQEALKTALSQSSPLPQVVSQANQEAAHTPEGIEENYLLDQLVSPPENHEAAFQFEIPMAVQPQVSISQPEEEDVLSDYVTAMSSEGQVAPYPEAFEEIKQSPAEITAQDYPPIDLSQFESEEVVALESSPLEEKSVHIVQPIELVDLEETPDEYREVLSQEVALPESADEQNIPEAIEVKKPSKKKVSKIKSSPDTAVKPLPSSKDSIAATGAGSLQLDTNLVKIIPSVPKSTPRVVHQVSGMLDTPTQKVSKPYEGLHLTAPAVEQTPEVAELELDFGLNTFEPDSTSPLSPPVALMASDEIVSIELELDLSADTFNFDLDLATDSLDEPELLIPPSQHNQFDLESTDVSSSIELPMLEFVTQEQNIAIQPDEPVQTLDISPLEATAQDHPAAHLKEDFPGVQTSSSEIEGIQLLASEPLVDEFQVLLVLYEGQYALMVDNGEDTVMIKSFECDPLAEVPSFHIAEEAVNRNGKLLYLIQVGEWQGIISLDSDEAKLQAEV